MTRAGILPFLLLGLTAAGCDIAADSHGALTGIFGGMEAKDRWERTYTLAPGGRLELINLNGKIVAESSTGAQVEVTAERSAKAGSEQEAQAFLAQIDMREEVGSSKVRVEVRAPQMSGLNTSQQEISWTLKIPAGVAVDLRTSNGGVEITGLNSEVRARSTNGGIKGRGLSATGVDAAVTNGGVDIELVTAVERGTFDLEAVNGGVSLTLPAASKASVLGKVQNGDVRVQDLPMERLGEEDRRRFEGTLNGGGARISLETTNGGVKIGAARSPS